MGEYHFTPLLVGFSGAEVVAGVAVRVEGVTGGKREEGGKEEKGGGDVHG